MSISFTYTVVVEPDDFKIGELLEFLEGVEAAITQMHLDEVFGVLIIFDWKD